MALFTYSQEPGISHGYSVQAQHLPRIFLLFSWTHMEIHKLWDSSSELILGKQPQRGLLMKQMPVCWEFISPPLQFARGCGNQA